MNKLREKKGFTLIEILVAISIFALILVAMMAVFNSALGAYQKGRAVKRVMEDSQFAISSIAKDVRMGKIESNTTYSNGGRKNNFMVTRNRNQEKVCYVFSADKLSVLEGTTNCSDGTRKDLVDLTGTGMTFGAGSGFYSCPSANDTGAGDYYQCPSTSPVEKRRGWVEINLDIGVPSMETDAIKIQTTVSSRDYGWEEMP